MKSAGCFLLIIAMFSICFGCTSKLVRIDSDPPFADILVNEDYIGKTPVYHRFSDRWYPWPLEITDDYVVEASLKGHHSDMQQFLDSPPPLNINYVPDKIFFTLTPVSMEAARDAAH